MSSNPRRMRSVGVWVLTAVGLTLISAGSGMFFLPDDAPPAPHPSAALRARAAGGAAVLPRVLTDQHRRPPRAFDVPGQPRTTAVSLLIRGEVSGRAGLYGTDAATGALVRLHDLPGTGGRPAWHRQDVIAVSPDGHLLSDGTLVADLRTAAIRNVAASVSPATTPGTVAVLNDGTVLTVSRTGQLWRYPPTASGRAPAAVTDVSDVTAIRAQTDGRVLVTGTHNHAPIVTLVDPAGDRPTVIPVHGLSPDEPAAEINGTLIHSAPSGGLELRDVRGRRRNTIADRNQFTGVQALGFGPFRSGAHTTGVALATEHDALTLSQIPLDLAASQHVTITATALTRIPTRGDQALPPTTRITPAAEAIAAPAILVDLPPEPWWAPLTAPGRPTRALLLIALGLLVAVLPHAVRRLRTL